MDSGFAGIARGPEIRGTSSLRYGQRREPLSFLRKPCQQRRRLVARVAGPRGEIREPIADMPEADCVRIEHRPTAPDRKAVAVDPDHVDVSRPGRDAFFENARGLVDHGEQEPLDDLVGIDRPPLHVEPLRRRDDELLDLVVWVWAARTRFVTIETLARLLSEAAELAQLIDDFGPQPLCLAHAPADIQAG